MSGRYRQFIFLLYTLGFIVTPLASVYYYRHLLGANNACDATQHDKNVLIIGSLISVVFIIIAFAIAFKQHDKQLTARSLVFIPCSLLLGFVILFLNAGCFF